MKTTTNEQNDKEKDHLAQSIIDGMKASGLLEGMSPDDELEIIFANKTVIRKIEEDEK